MSRIGKNPVPVPAGVDVTIDGQGYSVFTGNSTQAVLVVDNEISFSLA